MFALFRKAFNPLYGTTAARMIWRLPGARRLYGVTVRTLRPSSVTVRGHLLNLDAEDSLLLSVRGDFEDFEIELFERCIRSGDTVIDVGAHIGLYSLVAARAAGPGGHVYAFEPLESNRLLLSRNIEANGYTTITVSPLRSVGPDRHGGTVRVQDEQR